MFNKKLMLGRIRIDLIKLSHDFQINEIKVTYNVHFVRIWPNCETYLHLW